jgi:hypothetical protein
MRNIPILAGIILFWIILGTFTFYFSQDNSLNSNQAVGASNYSTVALATSFNSTSDWNTQTSSLSSIGNTLKFMFLFQMPTTGMPNGIAVFISVLDWLLVLILFIVVYRLASPFSGD